MADSKISQLTPITGANILDSDEFIIARPSTFENFSVTRTEFFQSTPAITTSEVTTDAATVNGNITVTGTVDGRDVAADGSKLDGIEALADVTDTTNVTAAGALMDSEVTNLADVKAFDPTDYATSAQGDLANSSLQPGDGGILESGDPPVLDDWNKTDYPSGLYKVGTSPLGDHPGGAGTVLISRWNATQQTQLYIQHFPGSERGQVWSRVYQNDEWTDWRKSYDTGNAVGTIAGGALIESGSTANGYYAWTADGTVKCTTQVNLGSPTAGGSGTFDNPYRTNAYDVTFPISFDSPPAFSIEFISNSGDFTDRRFAKAIGGVTSTGIQAIQAVRIGNYAESSDVTATVTATGTKAP